MHYKNGREAKNGDKVVVLPQYGQPTIGVLHGAVAGNDACNGQVAPLGVHTGVNLQECLHLDDVTAHLGDISKVPDTSKP